jgi:hypothetical protein
VLGCAGDAGQNEGLRIDSPLDGSVFVYAPERAGEQVVAVSASFAGSAEARRRIEEVEFVVDGEVVGRSRMPYRASLPAKAGDHELTVRPLDPRIGIRTASVRFSVR